MRYIYIPSNYPAVQELIRRRLSTMEDTLSPPPTEFTDTSFDDCLDVYHPLPSRPPDLSDYHRSRRVRLMGYYSIVPGNPWPDLSSFTWQTQKVLRRYGPFHAMLEEGFKVYGIMNDARIKELCSDITEFMKPKGNAVELSDKDCILVALNRINEKICSHNVTIKGIYCEITGERHYLMCLIDKARIYGLHNNDLFHLILQACLSRSKTFSVPYSDCLELSNLVLDDGSNNSMIRKQLATFYVRNLIRSKFLVRLQPKDVILGLTTQLTVGARFLAEISEPKIKTFGQVFGHCWLCQEALLQGYECHNSGCSILVHRHCYKKHKETYPNRERYCWSCKTPWNEPMKDRVKKNGKQLLALKKSPPTVQPPRQPYRFLPFYMPEPARSG